MERQLFADLVQSDGKFHKTKRGRFFTISLAIHVVGLLVVLIVPLLRASELPEPATAVKAFFVEPTAAPPPPPPPPPPKPQVKEAPKFVPQTEFRAPAEVPQEIAPSSNDLSATGTVEGGISGGVAGGIVGGLPAEPPPPVQAIRVGGNIKEPTKIKNVAPVYPDIAKQARVQGIVILECTISPQGQVTDVKVLRGIPLLDQAGIDAVKQWQYTPTLLNGVPVPVIMTVTVNFRLN